MSASIQKTNFYKEEKMMIDNLIIYITNCKKKDLSALKSADKFLQLNLGVKGDAKLANKGVSTIRRKVSDDTKSVAA